MHQCITCFIVKGIGMLTEIQADDIKRKIGVLDQPCPFDGNYSSTRLFYGAVDAKKRKELFPEYYLPKQLDLTLRTLYNKVPVLNALAKEYGISYQVLVAFDFDKDDGKYEINNCKTVDFDVAKEQMKFISDTNSEYRFIVGWFHGLAHGEC